MLVGSLDKETECETQSWLLRDKQCWFFLQLTVEDIWVFERQLSHPELRWRLCGRLNIWCEQKDGVLLPAAAIQEQVMYC